MNEQALMYIVSLILALVFVYFNNRKNISIKNEAYVFDSVLFVIGLPLLSSLGMPYLVDAFGTSLIQPPDIIIGIAQTMWSILACLSFTLACEIYNEQKTVKPAPIQHDSNFPPYDSSKLSKKERQQMLMDWWEQEFEAAVGAREMRIMVFQKKREGQDKEAAIRNTMYNGSTSVLTRERKIKEINQIHSEFNAFASEVRKEYNKLMLKEGNPKVKDFKYKKDII